MRLKTVGVVALALMMVLSVASLASADDEPSTALETTAITIPPGTDTGFSIVDPSNFTEKLVTFVLFWGFGDQETGWCPPDVTPDGGEGSLGSACLDVTGPNGQVNHGTFVSAFVHWLKTADGLATLSGVLSDYGPRGQFVRQAAQSGSPMTDGESSSVETGEVQHKGWSNPHNPHSQS